MFAFWFYIFCASSVIYPGKPNVSLVFLLGDELSMHLKSHVFHSLRGIKGKLQSLHFWKRGCCVPAIRLVLQSNYAAEIDGIIYIKLLLLKQSAHISSRTPGRQLHGEVASSLMGLTSAGSDPAEIRLPISSAFQTSAPIQFFSEIMEHWQLMHVCWHATFTHEQINRFSFYS